jgi:hypothetical protein
METSLVESNSKLRGNFIDYNSFLELSSETRSTPVKSYDPIIDFEIFRELKERLRHELKSRKDKTELMGLSASQIGLPVNAVYIERNDNSSVLLIDPKLKPNTKNAYPELFIKLIKCPNSPTPYHLGLFIKSAIITSTTSKPYILEEDPNDPTFKFSANLQRIIWASKGYLPGDSGELPMNYYNVSRAVESSPKLKSLFRNKDKVVSKEMIVNALWNNDEEGSDGAIRVYINRLKKILDSQSLKNVRGKGYIYESHCNV